MVFEPAQLVLSVAVLLTQAAPPESAPTEPAPAASAPARSQRVSVAIAGSAAETARLSLALTDAMRRLGVALELRRIPTSFGRGAGQGRRLPAPEAGEAPVTARLLFDLREREGVTLYVADDQRERVFVRRFDTPSGLDEVALEQLVLSASSSVEAVLAGHLIGVPRRDYEASLRPAKPEPAPARSPVEPRARVSGSLTGAYAASWLGPRALGHGPALGLKLERPPWAVGLRVQGYLPVLASDDESADVKVRLTTLGFRYRGWLGLPVSPRLSVLPGLGFGADFTQVSPRSEGGDAPTVTRPYWAADGMLQGYLAMAYLARSWSITMALGADFAITPVRYAVEMAPGLRDVFSPYRVRPFIELELAAALLP